MWYLIVSIPDLCNLTYFGHDLLYQGYSRKKYLGGEDGRQYIFLWVVGAESFQIIWVIYFFFFFVGSSSPTPTPLFLFSSHFIFWLILSVIWTLYKTLKQQNKRPMKTCGKPPGYLRPLELPPTTPNIHTPSLREIHNNRKNQP